MPHLICRVEGCEGKAWNSSVRCDVHKARLKHYGSEDVPLPVCVIGTCKREMVRTDYKLCATRNQQRYRYKIESERLSRLYEKHDGLCWVCLKEPATCIDHDHGCCPRVRGDALRVCGACVRGVLCGPCNRVLGMMNDDRELLQRAIGYLDSFEAA